MEDISQHLQKLQLAELKAELMFANGWHLWTLHFFALFCVFRKYLPYVAQDENWQFNKDN